MALTKQQFKKLHVGDLIEWNNMPHYAHLGVYRDIGIITQSQTFRNPNPNSQIRKFHQVSVKWNKLKGDTIDNGSALESQTLESLTLIAEAKQ